MISRFSHMVLDVVDVDRSLDFYTNLLGIAVRMEDRWHGSRVVYLQTGETELLLVQQSGPEHSHDRSGGLVMNFQVADLPSMAAKMMAKGIHILQPLAGAKNGERTLLVTDPDGYAVLLSEMVARLT